MVPPSDAQRFQRAITAIDAANAEDPHTITVDGASRPKERTHAAMTLEWVREMVSDASEALQLAAYASHIRRFDLPRDAYPAGRSGYLRWREEQKQRHAALVGEILADVGYDDALITRVQRLVRRLDLRRDPETQALEDALCLVFLQTQLDAVGAEMDRPRLLNVLRRTWAKMSEPGRACAQALPLSPEGQALLAEALEPPAS